MGINCANLVLLKTFADERKTATGADAPLGNLIMYGRLHNTLNAAEKARLERRCRLSRAALGAQYTEGLLRDSGASKVTSVDVSDYEGCDIVLDLMEDVAQRQDLADRLCGRFDTVLDYGTSEHVFNFPQALVNAWNMLKDGGSYIFDLPVTGWINHGLVQFTPGYFHSVGRTPYFSLQYLFFHGKHGRIVDLREFDGAMARCVHLTGKICGWGVLTKKRPPEMTGPLSLSKLRVMQVEMHGAKVGGAPTKSYSFDTIASGFRRQATAWT